MENAFRAASVPQEAVIVEVFPRFTTEASLQGTVRPVVGSVQIRFAPGAECTLGYNVALAGGSDWYFVTNSHCTESPRWTLTGHSIGQPTETSPIGNEVSDPGLFTHSQDSNCPPGKSCRYSDAALFRYNYEFLDARRRGLATAGKR